MRRFFLIFGLCVLLVVGALAVGRATSRAVDGIPCQFSEQVAYHVHAHLTITKPGGAIVYPPGGIGISLLHVCLYWVHTHNTDGMIHIEAPHRITPTLQEFFDIWGVPISRRQVWKYRVPAGQQLRVYVNGRIYRGAPGTIPLHRHTAVTLEVGPPYSLPAPVDWLGL